jgi:hypothetical protein
MPTTATQWLEEHPEDVEELDALMGSVEGFPVTVWTELPPRMKAGIAASLTETFAQDYWDDISRTTAGDAERVLRQGLNDGWSIRRMATEMADSFQGSTKKYARMRATRIARTESGNSLNAVRRDAMDDLQEDLGPKIPMKATWLSVLADTTRDAHANLDGVPADADGLFTLGGVRIPYPGHLSLPAKNRVNCMCSLLTSFGMDDAEASQLIADHYSRVAEFES